MFCIKCGTKLSSESNFCTKCGAKQKRSEILPNSHDGNITMTTKKRHGFVTFWLVLMLVFNLIALIDQFSNNSNSFNSIMQSFGLMNDYSITFGKIQSSVYIISVCLLLYWKKIGFWLIIGIDIINAFVTSNTGSGIFLSFVLFAVANLFLFGILNFRKNGISTWECLE